MNRYAVSTTAGLIVSSCAAAASGQIVVGDYQIGGFGSVSDLSGQSFSIVDDFSESGTGDFDFTRVLESSDVFGRSIRLEQSYSVVSTSNSVTFAGSIRSFETPGGFGGVPQFANQSHLVGGSVGVSIPAGTPIRIIGSLTHDPLRFPQNGQPVLLNGTDVVAGSVGLLASPLGSPADSFASQDVVATAFGASDVFFSFQSSHTGGGVGEPLGFANVVWSVTVTIIPTPGVLAIAPVGLLASRRRR